MKGCLAAFGVLALLILLLVGGSVVWFGFQANEAGDEIAAALAALEATNQQFPFTPPESGVPERFDAALTVRADVAGQLQDSVDRIGAATSGEGAEGAFAALKQGFGMMKEMMDLPARIARVLTDELTAERMSVAELRTTMEAVYRTLLAAEASDERARALLERLDALWQQNHINSANPKSAQRPRDLRGPLGVVDGTFDAAFLEQVLVANDHLAHGTAATVVDAYLMNPPELRQD